MFWFGTFFAIFVTDSGEKSRLHKSIPSNSGTGLFPQFLVGEVSCKEVKKESSCSPMYASVTKTAFP